MIMPWKDLLMLWQPDITYKRR